MKPTLIPSATKDTLIVPKLKKGIDGKLVFKKIDYHMWFEVEIIYADKSLGRYKTTNFNEIILIFFQKLSICIIDSFFRVYFYLWFYSCCFCNN